MKSTLADPQSLAELAALYQDELFSAAAYRALAHRIPEKARALRMLSAENRASAACLRGIYSLVSGKYPASPAYPSSELPLSALLRTCCGKELQCFSGYEYHRSDAEYGCVFACLSARKAEHCCRMLEIVGNMDT